MSLYTCPDYAVIESQQDARRYSDMLDADERRSRAEFEMAADFTEAQLLEADRHLAGPARDPQFFNRRTELYEQRRQREAERLELQHQEVV